MMLRKRSRSVGSKQGLMADSQSLPTLHDTKNNSPTATSLFPSPRGLSGLSPKNFSDNNKAAVSSTSALKTKQSLNSIAVACFSDVNPMKNPLASAIASTIESAESKHSKPVSLGILDVLSDDSNTVKQSSEWNGRKVLFASQLKIQVPLMSQKFCASAASSEYPSSPIEFGIRNKDSQLALFSPAQRTLSAELPVFSPQVVPASIPLSEMEHYEDYTRVISHGPNPRTTHIFDNCVVESCADGFSEMDDNLEADNICFSPNDSLNCCLACKKNFEGTKDIGIYS